MYAKFVRVSAESAVDGKKASVKAAHTYVDRDLHVTLR
jgi:hypothetical protein